MEINLNHRIGQGNTAEVYDIGDNKILKLFRNNMPKQAVNREYRNNLAVQETLDCVPRVYDLVQVEGLDGIVYDRLLGCDMLQVMLKGLFKVGKYARQLAHYHLMIQKPVQTDVLSVKQKLKEDLERVSEIPQEKKQKIIEYLDTLPDGDTLCHFDFHPGNVMMVNDKPFFLDWMTACKGDACADVMRTCILLTYGDNEHLPWVARKVVPIFQRRICRGYIKEYLAISHTTMKDVKQWELPVAAARLSEWLSGKEKSELLKLVNQKYKELAM